MTDRIKAQIANKAMKKYILLNLVVLAGLLVAFLAFGYGFLKSIRYVVLVEALFVIAWKDHYEKLIPNKYLLIMTGIRTFLLIVEWFVYPIYGMSILLSSLMGVAIGAGVFGLCYLISRGGMGAGDVKLMATLGYYMGGADIMFVMILAAVFSAVYSIVNLARKKTNLKAEIPFAPFVLAGTSVAMMLGV